MENGSQSHTYVKTEKNSVDDHHIDCGSFDGSNSDDEFFLGACVEECLLTPLSCFTERDLLGTLHAPTPRGGSACAGLEDAPPKELRLEGPGVLRGVSIPLPRQKKETRTCRGKESDKAKTVPRESKKKDKPAKSSAKQPPRVRLNRGMKALSPADLLDDDDYRR